jgi:hypothetical protein
MLSSASAWRTSVLGCEVRLYEQVPPSCTMPAAPPWPEDPSHPLAPLPTVRQANGVETTQGSFHEVMAFTRTFCRNAPVEGQCHNLHKDLA